MANKERATLRFRIGEESIPVVATPAEQPDSLFNDVILRSKARLEDIVGGQNRMSPVGSATPEDGWEYTTRNNILSFFGERGSGKTSCMRSLVKTCRNDHPEWLFAEEIDPSFFDKTHNILEILTGYLYSVFARHLSEWERLPHGGRERLRVIEEDFRKVKGTFRYLDSEKRVTDDADEYETEGLRHLDDGRRLRSLMGKLIIDILDFEGKECLIISIDDLDLNIPHSYTMMEHIRKYLVLPRVAILAAAKYGQLADSICLSLTKHYKDIPYRVSNRDISEMAERYLNKMFPMDQRFEMPEGELMLDAWLELTDSAGNAVGSEDCLTVAERVPAMIFERTRYLFYNSAGIPSLVVPRNLRDLRMLCGMLLRMGSFTADGGKEGERNQRKFKDYFFREWEERIDPEHRSFVRALLAEEDPAKVNRMIVTGLNDLFLKGRTGNYSSGQRAEDGIAEDNRIESHRQLLSEILNPENSYWNVSTGDVVLVMNEVRKLNGSPASQALLFFVETFYSMRIYELYNLMTDDTDSGGLRLDGGHPSDAPELRATVHGEWPGYFRLTGGSLFAAFYDTFIPPSSSRESRERRIINGQVLLREIQSVVEAYRNEGWNGSETWNGEKLWGADEYSEELSARLRLCEFFMLTIRDRVSPRSQGDVSRLVNEPLYFRPFGNAARNLLFDATAPFIYAVYPRFCYDRFNREIHGIAMADPNSLLNRMTRHECRSKENKTWELMSKASVRNMEILEDLTAWMHNNRDSLRPSGKESEGILSAFFHSFDAEDTGGARTRRYSVKTYHRERKSGPTEEKEKDDTPYYTIDYSILSLLGEVMDELRSSEPEENLPDDVIYRQGIFRNIFHNKPVLTYSERYHRGNAIETLSKYTDREAVENAFKPVRNASMSRSELLAALSSLSMKMGVNVMEALDPALRKDLSQLLLKDIMFRNQELDREIERADKELAGLIKEKEEYLGAIENGLAQNDRSKLRSHDDRIKRKNRKIASLKAESEWINWIMVSMLKDKEKEEQS